MRKFRILFRIVILPLITIAKEFPLDSVNQNQIKLTDEEKRLIKNNGFVVIPDSQEQLFNLYEDNWWKRVPTFVTTDLVLQLYHLFFSTTIRRIEQEKLYFRLIEFSVKMLNKLKDEEFRDINMARVYAYIGVANKLLGIDVVLPPKIDSLCKRELILINEHSGRSMSVIFPFMIDYSQFNPRGHYTRSEELKKYFKAMMWYGLIPFPLEDDNLTKEDLKSLTQSAILITLKLTEPDSLINLWEDIYQITSLFSGKSEAYTPREYFEVLQKIKNPEWYTHYPVEEIWEIDNEEFLSKFNEEVKKLRQPKIKQVAIGIPTGLQFRLFGQRYLLDSDIMQRLTNWPKRPFPKGLDIFAALGSERACKILKEVYNEDERWNEYGKILNDAQEEFSKFDTSFWYSSVCYAWLYSLVALNEPVSKTSPDFMKNDAWQDKSLNASLASWAELRHEAILYATQMYAECGDAGETSKGYVEPNPAFYQRIEKTLKLMYKRFEEKNLVTSSLENIFKWSFETLDNLNSISKKELEGVPLSEDEISCIWDIGKTIEDLTVKLFGVESWYAVADQDKLIACIADVATSLDKCLEVGVGFGHTIYVMVPIEGKWTLTKGAVFSYYEFLHPISDRLTDEKWQEMVREGKNSATPIWTKSFLSP